MQLELATLHLVVSPNGQHAARIDVPMLTTVNELHFIPIKTTHSPVLDRRSIAMHVLTRLVGRNLQADVEGTTLETNNRAD